MCSSEKKPEGSVHNENEVMNSISRPEAGAAKHLPIEVLVTGDEPTIHQL